MPTGLIEQAINGDKHAMRLQFESLESDISALKQTAGMVGANTDAATPLNPPPPRALLSITQPTTGWVTAMITNPQFLRTTVPGKKRGNLARSPMVHVLSYSPDPTFRTNVTTLPAGVQTHYQIPTGGQKLYFQIKSSVDGVNFNVGPHPKATVVSGSGSSSTTGGYGAGGEGEQGYGE